jgi:WD40 repeat protein
MRQHTLLRAIMLSILVLWSAACRAPAASVPATPTLPPTPTAALGQALQQFAGGSLLYSKQGALMLTDTTGKPPVWLNKQLCPPPDTIDVYGSWSADGQFVALACQNDARQGSAYILDMRSGSARALSGGPAVAFEWAPTDSRLLVNAQATYIVDATTGVTHSLPVTAVWEGNVYGPWRTIQGFADGSWYPGSTKALMSWSPDGRQIAVNATGDLYLLDAASLGIRKEFKKAFNQGYAGIPRWSRDGWVIFTAQSVPRTIPPGQLSPSSEVAQIQGVRLDVRTGATQVLSDSFNLPVWSPDGAWYVTLDPEYASLSLYQADGRYIRKLKVNSLIANFVWTRDSQAIIVMLSQPTGALVSAVDRSGQVREIVVQGVNRGYYLEGASWLSPDGALLALILNPPEHPQIGIYDLQGQQQVVVDGSTVLGWRPRQ